MTLRSLTTPTAFLVLLAFASALTAQDDSTDKAIDWNRGQNLKELYLPESINRVPEGNDFNDPESEFSFSRMVEGPNVAVFWAKEYGDVPMDNPDSTKRFDPYRMLEEGERYYRFYVDQLEYVKKGASISDHRKLPMFVFFGGGGTAFGGGVGDGPDAIGAFWTPATRVHHEPYGVIAHEMAHSFQFMSRVDAGTGASGPIAEMAAQYFLWNVLPEWQTFENYHLSGRGTDNFLDQTHLAFMHPRNMYHSPYVIEYWSYKHGLTFWGELNRQTKPGENVIATYKRLTGLSQEALNDEMFDACRRFITWDMPRVQETSKPYRNQHRSTLNVADDGWYRIAPSHVPQNYGYNGIKLEVPAAGTDVRLQFKGIAGAAGYNAKNVELAGWRYGFVAYKSDESRVYSETWSDPEATVSFTVPEGTEYLWLVVMGAPTEYFPPAGRRGWNGGRRGGAQTGAATRGGRGAAANAAPVEPSEEAWPYMVKLTNTSIDPAFIE